jgi:anthranilate/para-aminobenzoate synthase component I
MDHWPSGAPLLCLGGSGWEPLIATVFQEVSWTSVASESFLLKSASAGACGIIGLVSYDQWIRETDQPAPSRFFRIDEAIKVDPLTGFFHLMGSRNSRPSDFALDLGVAWELLAALNGGTGGLLPVEGRPSASQEDSISLKPLASSRDYLTSVEQVLEDIRDGRYYQLNLLRYFSSSGESSNLALASRLDRLGGPMSAWLSLDGLKIVSFSPERFITGQEEGSGELVGIEAAPIKGTLARSEITCQDEALKSRLSGSDKDRAELAMIVDLMRNDLARISVPRSVLVEDPGSVVSFSHVHHLVARISSRIEASLSLTDFLASLCPAGSITGAPKQEVTLAIRRYEGRPRRYFMGNIFYWNGLGGMNSSILIRTAVAEGPCETIEYAAGSGIVIRSKPDEEKAEIEAKTRVFADILGDF